MTAAARLLAAVLAAGAARADVGGRLLEFAGAPSRYVGSAGHRATLDTVAGAWKALGVKDLHREPVVVTAPVESEAWVEGPGLGRVTLHAVWPNHVQCSVTPKAGLSGPLVDGGHGEAAALNGHVVEGAIVLVRLPCAGGPQGWITPFLLGAAGVIFLPPADAGGLSRPEAEELFLDVPADLPRLWAPPAAAAALTAAARRGPRVTLVSRTAWREIRTENVWGTLPGSTARFPSEDKASTAAWRDKRVILQAYTDSMSVVPALAPGGEDACGLVALMELAAHFAAHPVPPTLILLATSGHQHVLAGAHDFLARHLRHREGFSKSITGAEKVEANYWIGLDLSSGDSRVAAFSQGTFYDDWDANLLAQNAWAGAARLLDEHAGTLWGKAAGERYLNGVSPPTRAWKDLLGYRAAFDAEAATFCGTPGLTFATPFDARLKSDTPGDTADRVDRGALARQVETLRDLLARALADARFFSEMKLELPDLARAFRGEVHEFERTITGLPNKPIAGALLTIRSGSRGGVTTPKTYGTVRSLHALFSAGDDPLTPTVTETGAFRAAIVRKKEYWNWVGFRLEGFVFDADGRIALAPDMGPLSKGQFDPDINFGLEDEKASLLQLFRCRPLTVLEPVDARNLRFLDTLLLQDENDQPFMNEGSEIVAGQSTAQEGFSPAVVVFVPREREGPHMKAPRVKVLLSSGPFGLQGVFTGADESLLDEGHAAFGLDDAKGHGYALDRPILGRSPYAGARDLWALDDYRGRTLRQYHVRNARIEALHQQAHAALQGARAAWTGKRYDEFLESSRRAWGLEARAYPEFKSVANDLVKTVVFYCLLLMPFSFCLERLLFSFATLSRQLMATAGIFVVGFGALSQVHPAFRISSNPMIIFLAFIVLSLGLIVLGIITSKFQRELRRLKGERGDYEAVDIGRVSATVAALILGLSNLRKRPLRTVLTITTILVLTFTVLSMVSLSSTIGFFRLPRGSNPPYIGALIRDSQWQSLQPPVEAYVRTGLGPDALVMPRVWVTARKRDEALLIEVATANGRRVSVPGLLGLSAEEEGLLRPGKTLGMEGRWMKPGERDGCLLPMALARRLGVGVGGTVEIRGRKLRVTGLFDGAKLSAYHDLDGEAITPAKFAVRRGRYNWETENEPAPTTSVADRFETSDHQPGDAVPILGLDAAMGMEGKLRALAIMARPGKDPLALVARIKDFLVRAAVLALVSDGHTIQLLSSVGAVSVSGTIDLLLPLLLAGLIVLNTMMGSVHERVREISIFSSVGLAPAHIGALFVAEAFVVAIVGVVLGYLLAQAVAAVLLSSGTLAGLSLNYSSSAAVGACIIVIVAVMLSTIYPARRASDLSVPDVTRRWALPKAEGDRLQFDFPFTVGQTDLIGLFTYLADLFRAYRDSSIGSFAADRVVQRRTPGGVLIEMDCWLAPYDLGISQHIVMEAIPMPVAGLYRVNLTLVRSSGEAGSWWRQNRRFLTTLRKRFLIWRMFGADLKAKYAETGRLRLEEAHV